jgi:lipoprotein-releasing system permease protein
MKQKGTFSSFIIRLAIVATALSVTVMVLALSFITGFKYEVREKLFGFWGHVHVNEYNPNPSNLVSADPIRLDSTLMSQISGLAHVKQVTPYILRPAILQAKGTMEGIKLKGITRNYQLTDKVSLTGAMPNFSDSAYSKDIMLSRITAARLNLQEGDELQLYFLEPGTTTPRIRRVRLAGLFHTGMDEVDREFGLCDLRLLQRINNWDADHINGYQLDLDQEAYSEEISDKIFDDFLEAPLTSNTMRAIYPNIFDWLQLQDINARIVLIIMALVAIINLAVGILILIVEKARMVGLFKALGMTGGNLQKIFLYHSLLIALAGIVMGNIFGLGLSMLQQRTGLIKLSEATYYVSQVPVRINGWHILLLDVATILLCLVCMWLPSLYIRRIQPARVLQFK